MEVPFSAPLRTSRSAIDWRDDLAASRICELCGVAVFEDRQDCHTAWHNQIGALIMANEPVCGLPTPDGPCWRAAGHQGPCKG